MSEYRLDPFEGIRKNAHVWRGENCIISYNERVDGSFAVLVLYDLGDKKRRLMLEVNDRDKKVEFKNDELNDPLYSDLIKEIQFVESLLKKRESEK